MYLPKGSPVPGPTALVAIFSGELLYCFEAKGRSSSGADEDDDASAILTPVSSSVVSLPVRSGAGGDSDWADVSMDRSMGQARVVEATPSSSLRHHAAQPGAVAAAASPLAAVAATTPNIPRVEILPAARSLPRPDELLRRPPYHLLVTARAYNEVEVQCSHSGSLVLLADYLRQWCRVNHNDTRNVSLLSGCSSSAYVLPR